MYKEISSFFYINFILVACAAITPVPVPTASPTPAEWDRAGWTLAWHDEFDGPALDLTNWTFDIGGGGWGNQELETYTNRLENVRTENGMLVIEARKESSSYYTSARIKTQGLHAWKYGRIEARIKIPSGQGIWPAFWTLGDDIDTKGWPASGEIDILESIGKDPTRIYGTAHGPGYFAGSGVGSSILTSADSLKNDFHVYALEWDENELRWYFDDREYFKVTENNNTPNNWVFDHPFFIILNVAIGGSWPGNPDKTTMFPQFLNVDYVRVYQRP